MVFSAKKRINPNGKVMPIFTSMYSQLKSCVKVKNDTSFHCYIGTRQGCVSSPTFFALLINDLISYLRSECDRGVYFTNEIEDIFALLFAGNSASVSDIIIRLQRQINLLERLPESVGMTLNLLKAIVIVFHNSDPVKQKEKWYYRGELIEVVSFYEYLGVFLPQN